MQAFLTYKHMQVYKFGGTSVGSPERMRNIAEILRGKKDLIVVLSAMSGTTDKLAQITNLLYESLKKEASEKCQALREEYYRLIPELLINDQTRNECREMVSSHFDYIRSFTLKVFSKKQEKAILAQGELLSTALFSS